MIRPLITLSILLGLAMPANAEAQKPVKVQVTQDVINANLGGFSATVGQLGNVFSRSVGSAFEPVQWRDRFIVTEGHPHSVIASAAELSSNDTVQQGFLDGASVLVFRIVNGKMRLVRRDKVSDGGHKASGWLPLTKASNLVPAQSQAFVAHFDQQHRSGVDYWFSVQAVAADGKESAPATPVRFHFERIRDGSDTDTSTQDFSADPWALFAADPATPKNLQVQKNTATGAAMLSWSPGDNKTIAGYRILRSDYAPAQHQGFRLDLEAAEPGAPALLPGDMVLVHKTLHQPSRQTLLSHRAYNSAHQHSILFDNPPSFFFGEDPTIKSQLEPHDADTQVDSPGRTALRIDMLTPKPHRYERYAFGDTRQPSRWWPVLDPEKQYVVEAWMRQEGMANPTVQFSVEGRYQGEVPIMDFEVTENWQRHRAVFSVPRLLDSEGPEGMMVLSFSGPGTLWLDNYRVYERGTPYLAMLPDDAQALRESKMTALRTHQFIKTRRRTYTMDEFTNPAGVINATGGNTLPQFLQILDGINMQPWLQVEFFMTPEEWLGFVEYIAAPYDPKFDSPQSKPWAAKRYYQGRHPPWTDAFEKIYFELSNETWNSLFAPWTFAPMPDAATGKLIDRGTVYGLFQEWVIEQLRASPYWRAELDQKFEFVIGGWAAEADEEGYGARAIAASPSSKHMTIADYIGGWDEGEGPAAANDGSFARILMHAAQLGALRSQDHAATHKRLASDGVDYLLGVYEAGPGYAMSGLNNQPQMSREQMEEQARAMKSLAAGTATLDSVLTKATYGFELNNFFTFSRSRNYWHSHATWYDGGQAYPAWLGMTLFNQHATGDLLQVQVQQARTIDMPKHGRKAAQNNLPLTAAYATRAQQRLSVFIISRQVQGSTPVTVNLPIHQARAVRLYRMTGDARAHNLDAAQVQIEEIPVSQDWAGSTLSISPSTGGVAGGMPAASVYLYVFEEAVFSPDTKTDGAKSGGYSVPLNAIISKFKAAWERTLE